MQRARALIAATFLLTAAACDDRRDPSSPASGDPAAVIFDGTRSNDAEDFFFLPPMMPDPARHSNFDDGAFNARLGPTVSICQLAADPNANPLTDCALQGGAPILIASFGSSDVQVSTTDEHYQVNWHTDESPVLVNMFYRIQVFVGSTRVGFADLDPVSSARELKSLQTGEVIPLVDGRTLPIKFRIEHGALCENKLDCGEFKVTDAGGTFLTNTKYAGVQFEPGFLPPGVEEITLTIERVPVGIDNQCHGASNPRLWKQWEACYSFETDPVIVLHAPATVGKCTELSSEDPLYDKQLGYKSHDGENLVALPNVILPVAFGLDCEDFMGTSVITQSSNPLLRLAQAGWRGFGAQVSRVFGVRPAYAIDLGLGDRVRVGDGFSQINWGIGLDGAIESGGEQSVGVGMAAAPLQLLITYSHEHAHSTDGEDEYDAHTERMGGVPVTFEVTTGNGWFALDIEGNPIRATTVMTSAGELDLGIASVEFTADPNGVANVVTATAPTLDGEPFEFIITGLPSDLGIAGLTRSVAEPTSDDALSWGFTVTNTGAGIALPSTARLNVALVGSADGPVATRDLAIPSLAPGATAVIEGVEAVGPLPAGSYIATATADHPGLIIEGSETNNSASDAFAVTDPADLALQIIEVQPADPTTADATRFIIAVQNLGSAPTPATTVLLDLDADVADQIFNVPALDPGSTATLIGPLVTIPTVGEYIARGTLDPTNAIPESNESNNVATLGYFVSAAPDLTVASFTRSPAVPTTADAVTYTIQIDNPGGSPTPVTTARLTTVFSPPSEPGEAEQSVDFEDIEVASIPAGGSLVLTLPRGTLPQGSHSASIVLDVNGVVAEASETNNTLFLPNFFVDVPAPTLVTVSGSVLDAATGAALPGATVSIGGTALAAVTNASGQYQLSNVPSGSYTVTASFIGYQSSSQALSAGSSPVSLNFQLQRSAPVIAVQGNSALTYFQSAGVEAGFTIVDEAGGSLQGLAAGPLQQCTDLNCTSAGTSPWLLSSFTASPQGFGTITLGNSIPLGQIAVGTYYFYIDVTSSNASNSPFRHRFSITILSVLQPGGDGGILVPPDMTGP